MTLLLKKLDFSYGKKKILKNLNFIIKNKSVTGIIGESGSGKSTLVNLLLGFLAPDQGIIKIDEVKNQ